MVGSVPPPGLTRLHVAAQRHASTWLRLPILLALVPPAVVIIYVACFRLGIPFWDSWALVPDLEKLYAGTITFSDLWRPHNEHRILIPRLILLTLAGLTHWDERYELALNIGLASATLLVWIRQWRRTLMHVRSPQGDWMIPLVSLFVFSLTQWENWLWGWQISFFLENLAALSGLMLLANWQQRAGRLGAALVLGVVATLTWGLGLMYWPLGVIVLLMAGHTPRRRLGLVIGMWCLVGAVLTWVYMRGLSIQGGPGFLAVLWQDPVAYAHYVLNYLGSPVLTYDFAFVFGLIGVVTWWAAAVWLAKRHWRNLALVAPYLGAGLYAMSGALIAGLTRLQFGTHQALASRYVTMSNPLWLTLALLLFLVRATLAPRPESSHRCRWAQPQFWLGLGIGAIAFQVAFCSVFGGLLGYYWRYRAVQPLREAALAGVPVSDAMLQVVYVDAATVRPRMEFLRDHHLALFRVGGP